MPAEMANGYQPFVRSHDFVCGDLCRHFSGNSRRPGLDDLVFSSGARPKLDLAKFPESVALGRLRGFDLFHGFGILLVFRPSA